MIKMVKKIKDYFWYGFMIVGISVLCVLILPYAIYKSFKHQKKSE